MKSNPAYKGKWSAPMIDNPAYKVRRPILLAAGHGLSCAVVATAHRPHSEFLRSQGHHQQESVVICAILCHT